MKCLHTIGATNTAKVEIALGKQPTCAMLNKMRWDDNKKQETIT